MTVYEIAAAMDSTNIKVSNQSQNGSTILDYSESVYSVALSQNGHWVAVGGTNAIEVFNVKTRQRVAKVVCGDFEIGAVAFSDHGKSIVAIDIAGDVWKCPDS